MNRLETEIERVAKALILAKFSANSIDLPVFTAEEAEKTESWESVVVSASRGELLVYNETSPRYSTYSYSLTATIRQLIDADPALQDLVEGAIMEAEGTGLDLSACDEFEILSAGEPEHEIEEEGRRSYVLPFALAITPTLPN